MVVSGLRFNAVLMLFVVSVGVVIWFVVDGGFGYYV